MKKILTKVGTLILGLFFVLVAVACTDDASAKKVLKVGSPEISGNFMSGFGNSAYDVWVRNLIFDYSTYATTQGGELVLNETVVTNVATSTSTRGDVTDKTYTFTIANNLKWSDGTAITAKDYVFSVLMQASGEWAAAGANTAAGDSLLGYEDYRVATESGFEPSAGKPFKGVQLLGDHQFSLTIDGTYLPYFYEVAFVAFAPLPFHRLAPEGATITSDAEDGATVSSLAGIEAHATTGGYRYAPDVTAGPYKFVSFANQSVVLLVKDENYVGNYEGKKPKIDEIQIREVNQAVDVDLVISGEIDMVTGVIEGTKIEKAKADANTTAVYYNRNGYGLLAMHAHMEPTSDYRVRQAIAHLTDRQYVADQVLGGYGSMVYSEYGAAQWMVQESEAWLDANLNKYEFSVDQANAILDTTAWKYEADGETPFDKTKATPGSEYYRHNADGEVMTIHHFGTENNAVSDALSAKFVQNMQLAGIKYDITLGTFDDLLNFYYYGNLLDEEEKVYSVFNLATNFDVAFDPYYSWHSSLANTDYNPQNIIDTPQNPAAPLAPGEKTLDELVIQLRTTTPGDRTTYLNVWRQYVKRWNTLIPNVPLYSNQYYDIYTKRVTFSDGKGTSPFWSWANAICYMDIQM